MSGKKPPYNDDDLMPFGKYEGERLGDIPDDYFLWLCKQRVLGRWKRVWEYARIVEREHFKA